MPGTCVLLIWTIYNITWSILSFLQVLIYTAPVHRDPVTGQCQEEILELHCTCIPIPIYGKQQGYIIYLHVTAVDLDQRMGCIAYIFFRVKKKQNKHLMNNLCFVFIIVVHPSILSLRTQIFPQDIIRPGIFSGFSNRARVFPSSAG